MKPWNRQKDFQGWDVWPQRLIYLSEETPEEGAGSPPPEAPPEDEVEEQNQPTGPKTDSLRQEYDQKLAEFKEIIKEIEGGMNSDPGVQNEFIKTCNQQLISIEEAKRDLPFAIEKLNSALSNIKQNLEKDVEAVIKNSPTNVTRSIASAPPPAAGEASPPATLPAAPEPSSALPSAVSPQAPATSTAEGSDGKKELEEIQQKMTELRRKYDISLNEALEKNRNNNNPILRTIERNADLSFKTSNYVTALRGLKNQTSLGNQSDIVKEIYRAHLALLEYDNNLTDGTKLKLTVDGDTLSIKCERDLIEVKELGGKEFIYRREELSFIQSIVASPPPPAADEASPTATLPAAVLPAGEAISDPVGSAAPEEVPAATPTASTAEVAPAEPTPPTAPLPVEAPPAPTPPEAASAPPETPPTEKEIVETVQKGDWVSKIVQKHVADATKGNALRDKIASAYNLNPYPRSNDPDGEKFVKALFTSAPLETNADLNATVQPGDQVKISKEGVISVIRKGNGGREKTPKAPAEANPSNSSAGSSATAGTEETPVSVGTAAEDGNETEAPIDFQNTPTEAELENAKNLYNALVFQNIIPENIPDDARKSTVEALAHLQLFPRNIATLTQKYEDIRSLVQTAGEIGPYSEEYQGLIDLYSTPEPLNFGEANVFGDEFFKAEGLKDPASIMTHLISGDKSALKVEKISTQIVDFSKQLEGLNARFDHDLNELNNNPRLSDESAKTYLENAINNDPELQEAELKTLNVNSSAPSEGSDCQSRVTLGVVFRGIPLRVEEVATHPKPSQSRELAVQQALAKLKTDYQQRLALNRTEDQTHLNDYPGLFEHFQSEMPHAHDIQLTKLNNVTGPKVITHLDLKMMVRGNEVTASVDGEVADNPTLALESALMALKNNAALKEAYKYAVQNPKSTLEHIPDVPKLDAWQEFNNSLNASPDGKVSFEIKNSDGKAYNGELANGNLILTPKEKSGVTIPLTVTYVNKNVVQRLQSGQRETDYTVSGKIYVAEKPRGVPKNHYAIPDGDAWFHGGENKKKNSNGEVNDGAIGITPNKLFTLVREILDNSSSTKFPIDIQVSNNSGTESEINGFVRVNGLQ